jgi:hypothetical protein
MLSYEVWWGDNAGVHRARRDSRNEAITLADALSRTMQAPFGVAIVRQDEDGWREREMGYQSPRGGLSDQDLNLS